MPSRTDTLLPALGLQRSGPRPDQWGDDPGSRIWRAGLTHAVLHRMLAKAEAPRCRFQTSGAYPDLPSVLLGTASTVHQAGRGVGVTWQSDEVCGP